MSIVRPIFRRSQINSPKEPWQRAKFRQLLPLLMEHKTILLGAGVLSLLAALASLAQPIVVGKIIQHIQMGTTIGSLVAVLAILLLLSSLLSGYEYYLLQRTGTAVVYSTRRRLIARTLNLPISEFDARRTGDLLSRIGTDTTLLHSLLTQGLIDAAGNTVIFVGALVAMAILDSLMLALVAVVLGIASVVVAVLSRRIRKATAEQQERLAELTSGVERAISAIRTVRSSGATAREVEAITKQATRVFAMGVRIARISAVVVPVSGVTMQASLFVVLGVGGARVASGDTSIAALVTFVMFLFMLVPPLSSFFGATASIGQALGAMGRIQEVLDLPAEDEHDVTVVERATDQNTSPEGEISIGAIEFRDVHFDYPGAAVAARESVEEEALDLLTAAHIDPAGTLVSSTAPRAGDQSRPDHRVLRGVSFTVPAGRRVALVGPSGAAFIAGHRGERPGDAPASGIGGLEKRPPGQ